MHSLKLLSLLFVVSIVQAASEDIQCDAWDCKIPYDKEGYQNGIETCYGDDAKTKLKEVTWVNGRRQGVTRCFKDGKVKVEANYGNDELNGLFIEYGYDLRGARVRVLKNGIPHGYSFSIDESGKVTDLHWCYQNGLADSADLSACNDQNYEKYSASLKAFQIEQQKKQKLDADKLAKKMNGPQSSKYTSGKIRATWTNVDGKISGVYKAFTEEGKLTQECHYKAGFKDGLCSEYDEAGRIDKKEIYGDRILQSAETFFDNGKVEEAKKLSGKNRYCYEKFYDSGMKHITYCKLDRPDYYWGWSDYDGPYEAWNDEGVLVERGQFEKGKYVGVWERFNGDGTLWERSSYENGNLLRSITFLNHKLEGKVMTPFKHRVDREYFPDGSLKKETLYPGHEGAEKQMVI